MIEDDFYATVKLKSGEEIFAKVAVNEEDDESLLIIINPVTVTPLTSKSNKFYGYKVEPWLKTSSEDMFIIKTSDILTISESFDVDIISMYQNFVRSSKGRSHNSKEITKKMGYISNVNDAKEILENLYKNS